MKRITGGTPRKPPKLGTVQTVDVQTGEVVSEEKNAFTLLPCAPDKCQECAVDHAHDQPHNQQSLHYQYSFYATHGRWPTWADAMAHCSDDVKAVWRAGLVAEMTKHGMTIPADLIEDTGPSR